MTLETTFALISKYWQKDAKMDLTTQSMEEIAPTRRVFKNKLDLALTGGRLALKQKALINRILPFTREFNHRGDIESSRFARQIAHICPEMKVPKHSPQQPWSTTVTVSNEQSATERENWSCTTQSYVDTCIPHARVMGFSPYGYFEEPYWNQVKQDPVPSTIARRLRRRPSYQTYQRATNGDTRYVVKKPRHRANMK